MGWEDIALQIGQIAGPVLGGVLGNRAANQGVTQGRADITGAMNQANQYMQNYVQNAKPLLDWYIQQSTALPQWAYNQGVGGLNYGMGQAFNARNQGMNNALAQMQAGFGQGQQFLSPYATIGQNALSTLSQHVLKRPQAGASLPSGRFPTPTPSAGFTPFQGTAPPNPLAGGLPKFTSTTGGNALSSMMGGGPEQFNSALTNLTPGTGSRVGAALGGLGVGAAVSGGLGMAFPMLASVLGPIGLAAGAVAAPLITLFTRKGREKVTASDAANSLGSTIENMWAATKSGQMTSDQFQQAVQAAWVDYQNFLRGGLKDTDVIAKSLASQANFINQSLRQKGLNFTVSSPEGSQWAQGGNPF